jgi:hypothetical protein
MLAARRRKHCASRSESMNACDRQRRDGRRTARCLDYDPEAGCRGITTRAHPVRIQPEVLSTPDIASATDV